jgi:hypothetical protein
MPGKAVIVCIFDEPDDDMTLAAVIYKAQEEFNSMPGVKLRMGIKDVADRVIEVFSPLDEEESDGAAAGPQEGG